MISLQLVDRFVKYSIGIPKDILIKVSKLFMPVDFVVLEIEEDTQIPIILRRSFLATIWALIDVKNSKLSMNVCEENMEFDLANSMKCSFVEDSRCRVDLLEQVLIKEMLNKDLLQLSLVQGELENEKDVEARNYAWWLEANNYLQPKLAKTKRLELDSSLYTYLKRNK